MRAVEITDVLNKFSCVLSGNLVNQRVVACGSDLGKFVGVSRIAEKNLNENTRDSVESVDRRMFRYDRDAWERGFP